jgi:hypothetical protein
MSRSRVRLVAIEVRQSHYVGDVKELERLIDDGYEIVASTAMGDHIIFTLVRS